MKLSAKTTVRELKKAIDGAKKAIDASVKSKDASATAEKPRRAIANAVQAIFNKGCTEVVSFPADRNAPEASKD